MPVCKLSQVWDSPTFGTGPFRTSLEVDIPTSSAELQDAVDAWEAWWAADTLLRPYIYSGLGTSQILGIGTFAGVVVEVSAGPCIAPSGLAPELPGVSFRVGKLGNRPEGGRRGSMFWPGAENSAHDGDGILQGSAASDIQTSLDNLRDDLEASNPGVVVVQSHTVAGNTTVTAVTGFDTYSTVSFLQRRYR